MYGLRVARQKAADPKVAVTIRLPKSVKDAWDHAAEAKGLPAGRALMEAKLIEAVTGPHQPPPRRDPEDSGRPRDVTPNFRATK